MIIGITFLSGQNLDEMKEVISSSLLSHQFLKAYRLQTGHYMYTGHSDILIASLLD